MKTTLIINVSNCIDMITNSSSELFIVEANKPVEVVKDIVDEIDRQCNKYYVNFNEDTTIEDTDEVTKDFTESHSGDGGSCDVKTIEEFFNCTEKERLVVYLADYFHKYDKNWEIIEYGSLDEARKFIENNNIFFIDIDHSRRKTIAKISSVFNVLNKLDV